MFSATVLVLLLLCCCVLFTHSQELLTIETTHGPIVGVRDNTKGADYWKSIPFAQPPLNKLRWRSPTEPTPWTTPLNTTVFGPQCVQDCVLPTGLCANTMSEDCLTLNVYRPSTRNDVPLPVMVFLPGGHFDMGTANCDIYEGSYFAKRGNVILVTVNYRLGVLGFMVDKTRGLTGNYGLQDQRLALQWVQKNVAKFGGDPNLVTLFGESAGAASVTAHLVSPLSQGLFHRVIVQSVPLSLPFFTTDVANDLGQRFAKVAGCSDDATDACIMNIPADKISALQDKASNHLSILHPIDIFMPYTPTIDGKELTMGPMEAFSAGLVTKYDIMMGSCTEEARMFVYLALSTSLSTIEYDAAILGLYRTSYIPVHRMYPPQHDDKREDFSVLGTDYIFASPTRFVLSTLYNQTRNPNLYLYQFDHVLSFDGWGKRYPFCVGHTCHGADVPFTFHSFGNFSITAEEDKLSNTMIDYWTNFAFTGSPNSGPHKVDTNWTPFTTSNLSSMYLTTPSSSNTAGFRKEQCDMWDSLGYNFGV